MARQRRAAAKHSWPSPARGTPPPATKAAPIILARDVTAGEACRAIIRACLTHLLADQPSALVPTAEGGVHQMRVALRRARSAIRLFDRIPLGRRHPYVQNELRWLGRVFGRARDWDVFLSRTLPRARLPKAERVIIAQAAERERRAAHARVQKAFAGARYAALLQALESDADAKRKTGPAGDAPLAKASDALLGWLARKTRKAGRGLAHHSAQERHELRKAVKKLRYGADFLGSLYPRKKAKRYGKRLAALQDLLGEMNDLVAADHLVRRLKGVKRGRLRRPSRDLHRRLSRRLERLEPALRQAWRDFRKAEPFWN